MISIVLLLKITGVIIVAAVWLCVYHNFKRRLLRLERCRERCEARLDTLTQLTEKTAGEDMPEADLAAGRLSTTHQSETGRRGKQ